MAGFLGALAGGLGKGLGKLAEREFEEAKIARAEKWQQLSLNLQQQQLAQTGALTREQMASNEAMQKLQLGTQKGIAELQAKTTTQEGAATRETQTGIAKLNAETQKALNESDIRSREYIAGLQTKNAKDIVDAQIAAAADLNIKPIQMNDGTWRLMRGKEMIELPNDPRTGKPLVPLAADTDTDAMKNYKFLLSSGVDPATAFQVFQSKNVDPQIIISGLMESYMKSKFTDVGAYEWAVGAWQKMQSIPGATMAGAPPPPPAPTGAGAPPAAAPAADTSEGIDVPLGPLPSGVRVNAGARAAAAKAAPPAAAPPAPAPVTIPPKPAGVPDDVLVKQAKAKIAAGVPADQVKTTLKAWKIDPAANGIP